MSQRQLFSILYSSTQRYIDVQLGSFIPFLDFAPDEEEWKKKRQGKIAGTDVSKILGCDHCCSAKKLFECKIKGIDPIEEKASKNKYLRYLLNFGKVHEAVARNEIVNVFQRNFENNEVFTRELFNRIRDKNITDNSSSNWRYHHTRLIKPSFLESKNVPWGGTPDIICELHIINTDDNTSFGLPLFIFEIKCHSHPSEESAMPYSSVDEIPYKYIVQVQAYLCLIHILYYSDENHYSFPDITFQSLPINVLLFSWTKYHGWSMFKLPPCYELINLMTSKCNDFKMKLDFCQNTKENNIKILTNTLRSLRCNAMIRERVGRTMENYKCRLLKPILSVNFYNYSHLLQKELLLDYCL